MLGPISVAWGGSGVWTIGSDVEGNNAATYLLNSDVLVAEDTVLVDVTYLLKEALDYGYDQFWLFYYMDVTITSGSHQITFATQEHTQPPPFLGVEIVKAAIRRVIKVDQ